MSSEEVNDVKNEEATVPIVNEIIEEAPEKAPEEEIKEATEETPKEEQPTAKAKPKATAKKLPRTVKVVELVECNACNKKMLPKSLKNTHPHYCKGQPTETLPVNKQKASYGSKVEQKLRKEIEEEMRKKYEVKNVPSVPSSDKQVEQEKPVRMKEVVKQPTATELLHQSYNEIKRLRQQEKQEKIQRFRSSMF